MPPTQLPYKKLPLVCFAHNDKGCRKGDECGYLHVCGEFMKGRCKLGTECPRKHELFNTHNNTVLEKCGVEVKNTQKLKGIVGHIRTGLLQREEAEKAAKENKSDSGSDDSSDGGQEVQGAGQQQKKRRHRGRGRGKKNAENRVDSASRNQEGSTLQYRRLPQLCEYYSAKDCFKPECTYLHICKYFTRMTGCKQSTGGCKKIHDLHSDHNKGVLIKCGINIRIPPGKLLYDLRKAWLVEHIEKKKKENQSGSESEPESVSSTGRGGQGRQRTEKKPLYVIQPTVCPAYNSPQGCSLPDCLFMHMCRYNARIKGCRQANSGCGMVHNIYTPHNKRALQSCGVDTKMKANTLQTELRKAWVSKHMAERKQKPEASDSDSSSDEEEVVEPGQRRKQRPQPEQDKIFKQCPSICIQHNKNGCKNDNCRFLHVCKLYVEKSCKEAHDACKKQHDIVSPHNRNVLATCGFQLGQKPKFVLQAVREAMGVTKKPDTTTQEPSYPPGANPKRQTSQNDDEKGTAKKGGKKKTGQTEVPQEQPKKGAKNKPNQPPAPKRQTSKNDDDKENPKKGGKKKTEQVELPQEQLKKGARKKSASQSSDGVEMPPAEGNQSNVLPMTLTDDTTICIYKLLGNCIYNDNCPHFHNSLPFLWQYKIPLMGWRDFNEDFGKMTEATFTDVNRDYVDVMIESSLMKVDFEIMKASGSEGQVEVRRLSTVSAAVAPPGLPLITQWCWYWKEDNNEWKPFTGSTSDNEIEQSYQGNPGGLMKFKRGQHKYSISFRDMTQMNVSTKNERPIRRRPQKLMTADDVKNALKNMKTAKIQSIGKQEQSSSSFPDEWEQMGDEPYKLIPLKSSHKRYKEIKKSFAQALSGKNIHGIKRVQNLQLWQSLMWKKESMEKANGPEGINEMFLYHGTTAEAVPAICQQNFDWRLSATRVGAKFGQGSYFHKDPAYSDSYSTADQLGIQRMFVARILVGKYCKGKKDYRRPPPLDPCNPMQLYDSMVDKTTDPSIYVISYDSQYYPEFIVEYR